MINQKLIPLLLCMAFTGLLLAVRIAFTGTLQYVFLGWNLFLAWLPFAISTHITTRPLPCSRWRQYAWLLAWLLVLPNAPYIITDFVHFTERPPVPLWYDLALLFMASFTGLLMAFWSLSHAERQWRRMYPAAPLLPFRAVVLFLCSFGIYLGRFGRFNSWDVVSNPGGLLNSVAHRVAFPLEHVRTWGVTLLFTAMLFFLYTALKSGDTDKEAGIV